MMKTKRRQNIITDWEFSRVTRENARIVWAFKVFRQCAAETRERSARGQKSARRKLLKTPWTKVPWDELDQWYTRRFGGGNYQALILQPDGSLTLNNDLVPLFCDCGESRRAPFGTERYGFYLNKYVPASVAKALVQKWFSEKVLPFLVRPLPKRGRIHDPMSWLVDLAVYRASKAGVSLADIGLEVAPKLPKTRRIGALYIKRTSERDPKTCIGKERVRQFVYGAKKRTVERLRDIRVNTFCRSVYGCRDSVEKPILDARQFR